MIYCGVEKTLKYRPFSWDQGGQLEFSLFGNHSGSQKFWCQKPWKSSAPTMFIPKAAPNPKQKKVHKTNLTFLSQGWRESCQDDGIILFGFFHLFNLIPEKHGTKFKTSEESKDVGHNRNTWNRDDDFDRFCVFLSLTSQELRMLSSVTHWAVLDS